MPNRIPIQVAEPWALPWPLGRRWLGGKSGALGALGIKQNFDSTRAKLSASYESEDFAKTASAIIAEHGEIAIVLAIRGAQKEFSGTP